jgi:GTP cyclohydrolase II
MDLIPPIAPTGAAVVPTEWGDLQMTAFVEPSDPAREHVALVLGDVRGRDVLVRVHSECLTSEVFGSLKCDCAHQLRGALDAIRREGRGVLLYLRQEGRGIGLGNKLRAYALQSGGLDTVDANAALGLPIDGRRYEGAAAMLRRLGVASVRLLTNNPDKVDALVACDVPVRAVPLVVPARAESLGYLESKRDRMRHELPRELLVVGGRTRWGT